MNRIFCLLIVLSTGITMLKAQSRLDVQSLDTANLLYRENLEIPFAAGRGEYPLFYYSEDDLNTASFNVFKTTDGWTFEWFIYNNPDFSLLNSEIGDTSTLQNAEEGLYLIKATKGSVSDSSFFHVQYLSDINQDVEIRFKDGDSITGDLRCSKIVLSARVTRDSVLLALPYEGLVQEYHYLPYQLKVTTDPDGEKPAMDYTWLSEDIPSVAETSDFPTDYVTYTFTVKDLLGSEVSDQGSIRPIHTEAKFDTLFFRDSLYINNEWVGYYGEGKEYNTGEDSDNVINSAPITLGFDPKPSENAISYQWIIEYDTTAAEPYDSVYNQPDSIVFTWYKPNADGYRVLLTTQSWQQCTHEVEMKVHVQESSLGQIGDADQGNTTEQDAQEFKVPNVFTPNGDSHNDIFRIRDVSIKEFEITIFNRYGRIVHKFRGDDIRDWNGWDGTYKGTNEIVPDGVYFYVIKAKGYDGVEYRFPPKDQKNDGGGFLGFGGNNTGGSTSNNNTGNQDDQNSGNTYSGILHVFTGQD